MQSILIKKSFFRPLALTSVLLPVLALSNSEAYAAQTTANTITATTALVSPSSEAKDHLMAKLGKLAFFSAQFSQHILDAQGEILQQGSGTIAISKPNLVNWKTITPDETLIVSDGNTLWFYDPFIEQASAYSLAKSIHNTPILLLTSDDPQLWQQYNVIEQKDVVDNGLRFVVMPKNENSQIKKLTLSFTNSVDVQLSEFSFQDATGQVSQISLTKFNSNTEPADTLFNFSLPEGVRLEDKR
ncbi:outer membrane lipoprotein chaperone LolA [Colwellia psychrerythraea]|uniref:Outer-membrane lipoprotein carrier protein n=1 Tax=Colwellia psychrerythraea TaxID=28229 RepID=A0A099KPW2_COLPS|nr:outer membrane lipoprotein chaperone LolA [Colwellia psychrerythraea]KGJ91957.1 Outer-membrane lipoprotein carrier protein [Colwellia psychrerythraea]